LFELEIKRSNLEQSRLTLAEKQKQLDQAKLMGNDVAIKQLSTQIQMEKDLQKGIESGIATQEKALESEKTAILNAVVKAQTELDKLGGDVLEVDEKVKKKVEDGKRAGVELITLASKDVAKIGMEIVEQFPDTFALVRNAQRGELETMLNDNRNSLKDMQTAVNDAYKNRVISQEEYIAENLRLNALEVQGQRDTAKAIGDVLGAMSDLVGKQTKAGKVMATASALINTYLGISEVLKAKNPYPEPFGTAIKIANASVIGINGFKQVREINKVQIPNQPGGNSPTGSQPSLAGASGSSPSMGAIGSQLTGATKIQLNQFENMKNPVVRAYVVESEVTGTQQRAKRLKQTSKIN
jgi:hypothetical protein